jgi:hypothetical protein
MAQLCCYNMFSHIDGEFMEKVVTALQQPDGRPG